MKVQYSLLKIQLDYIIQNNKNIDLTNEQKNSYKVKLADNQLFRLIRLHKGNDNAEELFKKQQEKKELKNNFTKEKPELSKLVDLLSDISEMEFIKELIFIEIPEYGDKKQINKNIEDIYRNGFVLDKTKYIRWGKSSSMTRHNIVCFIDESINDAILERTMMGIELKEVVIAKWEAYFNLLLSSCEFVKMPYIVVINDYKHIISPHKVQFVVEKEGIDKDTGKKYTYKDIEVIEKDNIEINAFDGEGVCNKRTSIAFQKQLGLKYKPVAWVIRLPLTKGCVIEMDIQKYCKENNVKTIKDYWGKEHDTSKIDIIITKSQFKGIEFFNSWQHYLDVFSEFDHCMGITRYNKSPQEESIMSRYNFQYLQTLNLGDKIIDLAQYSTNWAEKIIKGDKLYTLLFLGTTLNENSECEENEDFLEVSEIINDSNKYQKAILLNDKMLQDTHIQNEYLYNMLRKYITEMKFGKIWINGKYEFLYADTYAFLQHACGHKVTGLLNEYEHWSYNKSDKWITSRSPLMDGSEHNKMNFINNKETKKWFGHLYHGVMINIFGLDTMRMSDCDHDGDIVMSTNNEIICDSVVDGYPITMDKKTAKKEAYVIDNIIKSDCISFSNLIGKITNTMTTFINANVPDKYKNINIRRIKLGRYYQGVEIDSCKLGVKEYMPKKWREQTKKLPYFLMYKYLYIKDKYDKVHRQFAKSSKQKFGVSFNELFKFKDNDKIKTFLNQYYKAIPVSLSDSPMNKLCHFIEAWERENFRLPYLKEYCDTTDVMTDKSIQIDENSYKYKKIDQLYHEFMKEYNKGLRQDYTNHQWHVFYYDITTKCLEVVDNESELANIAVDITYKKYSKQHKKFAWVVASDGILKNLEKNRQSPIEVPVETGNPLDTEYLGRYYKLHEVDI